MNTFGNIVYIHCSIYVDIYIYRYIYNSCVLFATVNRLTNPPISLPLKLISTSKCNEFAIFFNDKVQVIIIAIISTTQITTLQPARHLKPTHFTPVTDKTVEEIICSLSSSACCLDALPTRFLNISLQTGPFPKALKTAFIKSLLKKRNQWQCHSTEQLPAHIKPAILRQSPRKSCIPTAF